MEVRDPETYSIIGAAMEVHRTLGHGFLESVYQEALAYELGQRQVIFRREAALPILYKGMTLACTFRADFICCNNILVELKALSRLSGTEDAQIINYMKASGIEKALLLNFGAPSLEHKRIALSR